MNEYTRLNIWNKRKRSGKLIDISTHQPTGNNNSPLKAIRDADPMVTNAGGLSQSPSIPNQANEREPNANSASSLSASPSSSSMNMNAYITLPPISSFDNLIRAAEKQYVSEDSNDGNRLPSYTSIPVALNNDGDQEIKSTTTKSNNVTTTSLWVAAKPQFLSGNKSSNQSLSSLLRLPSEDTEQAAFGKVEALYSNSKVGKPRRKKQCSICMKYFANLTTHKATHLTPEDRPHRCPICRRGFARNNDLLRHKKRHWIDDMPDLRDSNMSTQEQLISLHNLKGTFRCPFNKTLIRLDMDMYPYKGDKLNFEPINCHNTGVFSRCDTFKNHLRAYHFSYPVKTQRRDRVLLPGKCKHCGKDFENSDIWFNEHIGKDCGYSFH